jgi:hypothetical protein
VLQIETFLLVILVKFPPVFIIVDFYDKVSSGKAKKEAVVIVARKLAHIILAIYKNNVAYNPQRVFVTS